MFACLRGDAATIVNAKSNPPIRSQYRFIVHNTSKEYATLILVDLNGPRSDLS